MVLKIASPDILHKTDVEGVKVGLENASEVKDAFELMVYRAQRYLPEARLWGCLVQEMVPPGGLEVLVGMLRDPQFGPLVTFGLGGIYVETLKDVTFRVAPFSRQEARDMLTEIRTHALLDGVRGQPTSTRRRWSTLCCGSASWSRTSPRSSSWISTPWWSTPPARACMRLICGWCCIMNEQATSLDRAFCPISPCGRGGGQSAQADWRGRGVENPGAAAPTLPGLVGHKIPDLLEGSFDYGRPCGPASALDEAFITQSGAAAALSQQRSRRGL